MAPRVQLSGAELPTAGLTDARSSPAGVRFLHTGDGVSTVPKSVYFRIPIEREGLVPASS